ncbi:hypothetical protein PSTG_14757 [Puccinia striiformis f. sp. tritici PST-78]|uniref:Uncharacterized protein n=2 Tax=Puccinia striiformis f. sp. tritici TaxID=168172 RepID=A0A0L0UXS9_9BASI|nr:hypothetical protein PSTG_14757 [Puccinia striiformis f. sp. tritici PST-78]
MTKTFSQNIPGHGSAILRLSETKEIPKRNFVRFAAEKAEVVSPAYFRQVGDIKVAAGIEPEGSFGNQITRLEADDICAFFLGLKPKHK